MALRLDQMGKITLGALVAIPNYLEGKTHIGRVSQIDRELGQPSAKITYVHVIDGNGFTTYARPDELELFDIPNVKRLIEKGEF